MKLTKIEVREISTATGETIRTLLKVDGTYKGHALSPDGTRLAAVESSTDRVSVWDVARGEKVSAYDLPPEKEEEDQPAGPFGGRPESMSELPVSLLFSTDGKRVVCFRAPHASVVLNADKGEPLPALEQADRMSATGVFAAGGRLLVASGSKMTEDRRTLGKQGFAPSRNAKGFGQPGQAARAGGRGGPMQTVRSVSYASFVGVWDTATGKRLRGWDRPAHVAVNPARPMMAILENNGDGGVRLGLWDLPDQAEKK